MADYCQRSEEGQAAFLAAYAVCGTVSGATKAAQINAASHYSWLQHDPDYPHRFAETQRLSAAALEEVARDRAIRGERSYKFYKDKPLLFPDGPRKGTPYFEQRKSDALLMHVLKANHPEKFADRVQHGGADGPPIRYVIEIVENDDFYGNSEKIRAAENPVASAERDAKLRAFQATHLRQAMDEVGFKPNGAAPGTRPADANGSGS